MDRLGPLNNNLHPITKAWVASIMALAALTSMDLVSPTKFLFLPSKISSEPWRLVTCFCYFGPVQFQLIQYILILFKTNNSFESLYVFRSDLLPHSWTSQLDEDSRQELNEMMGSNKTIDFAHFIVRIACSIIAVVVTLSKWTGNFLLLGPALVKILLYISCRNAPNQHLLILGIVVRAKYAPFLNQFLEFVISADFMTVSTLLQVNVKYALRYFASCDFVRQTLLVFCIGHLWWYIQYFYLTSISAAVVQPHSETFNDAYQHYSNKSLGWLELSDCFKILISPPWYYFTCRKLLSRQILRVRRAQMAQGIYPT